MWMGQSQRPTDNKPVKLIDIYKKNHKNHYQIYENIFPIFDLQNLLQKEMPKVGGRRKKARSHKEADPVQEKDIPKTFVFKKGKCSDTLRELSLDFRKCFYPNTAMKLEDSNKLSIKSYLKAAKYYEVTHLVAFQQSKQKTYARFIKVGGGEILFRVMNYCRMKDILKNNGQHFNFSLKQPLIVLNNFTENNQVRQIGRSLQEMFSSINLETINLKIVKRVLSFTYQPNKKCIYFRHYKIIINEGGINHTFKQLTSKIHSNLSQFRSFGEYLQNIKANENKDGKETQENQQEVKLIEIGPRMKLKFVSFKEGFGKIQDQQEQQNTNRNDNENVQSGNKREQRQKEFKKQVKKQSKRNKIEQINNEMREEQEQRMQDE